MLDDSSLLLEKAIKLEEQCRILLQDSNKSIELVPFNSEGKAYPSLQ